MNTFLDSNLFVGLATVVTGLVAIIIYFYQKRDVKMRAARVLLTEIRIAEDRIDEIKEKFLKSAMVDFPSVFPTNSWKKYAHTFISDFDQDELKMFNRFYDYGELVEEFVRRYNEYFWIATEERNRVSVRGIYDIISKEHNKEKSHNKEVVDKKIVDKLHFISDNMDKYNLPYTPIILDKIRNYIEKIPNITTSSCGVKLKKLAKIE